MRLMVSILDSAALEHFKDGICLQIFRNKESHKVTAVGGTCSCPHSESHC